MAVALEDDVGTVDLGDLAALREMGLVGTEPHGAAEIALGRTPLDDPVADPFGHQADQFLLAGAELGGARAGDPGQVARRFQHRHLHAEADAEIGHAVLAGESGGRDLAFGAALAETAGHQDTVH